MKRLQSILHKRHLALLISAILSSIVLADNEQGAFPPIAPEQKITKSATVTHPQTVANPQNKAQAPVYYQPIQGYRQMPYAYYYPQQYMPMPRQWYYYPQQRANTPYPYQPSAVMPPKGNQIPSYPQQPAYQNPTPNNAIANRTGKTLYPMRKKIKKEKHPWGDKRNIWPDFYTGFTKDAWDKMINAPFDVGRMPGGWRAPSLSTPDPATVSDAVANQVPPILEEMGNMTHLTK